MLIFAEPEEVVGADFAGQSEPFRARPPPLARYALPFVIVVADGKVLLKVFLRIPETVLRLCGDHAGTLHSWRTAFVYLIHNRADTALNCQEIAKRVGIPYGINVAENVRLFPQKAGVILMAAARWP